MVAKRSKNEGTVSKLPSGTWRAQIMDGFKPDGRRNIVSFTAPTKGEALQKMQKYLVERAAGKSAKKEKLPFSEWADTWYVDYKTQVQESTYSNYYYTLKTLKDHFGSRPIQDIHLLDINIFLTKLFNDGFSESKIKKCKAMLIQIFSFAEDNEKIVKNPALKAKVIKEMEGIYNTEKDAFTPEETRILFCYLPDDLLGNSIRVLLISGMRVQELIALTPNDIAEDGSWIDINKAIKTVNGSSVLGKTKSKSSVRVIPIPKDYRVYVKAIREQGGKTFIWTSRRSNLLYSVSAFRKRYYSAISRIKGVRKLTPHCCRHTYVTRLESLGVPLQIIAHLVGHSKTDTTVGYTHTSYETLSNAVSALNDKDTDS